MYPSRSFRFVIVLCIGIFWCSGSAFHGAIASTGPEASLGEGPLAPLLRSSALDLKSIIWKKFVDLDQDGRKEILLHGEGRIRELPPGVTIVQAREKSIDGQGNLVLHPLRMDGNRVFGVFRYEGSQNAWRPMLLGSFRASSSRGGRWPRLLRIFQAEDLVGDGTLELRIELAEQGMSGDVHHKIYALGHEGFRSIYAFTHPKFGCGGVKVEKNRIVETTGLRTPFQSPAIYYESLRAVTVHRWVQGAFEVALRRLHWHDFSGDLPWNAGSEGAGTTGSGQGKNYRRVWFMQKAHDAGRMPGRGSPEAVARLQADRMPEEIVESYRNEGLCVLTLKDPGPQKGRDEVVYLYQPFHRQRGEESIWVAVGELSRL